MRYTSLDKIVCNYLLRKGYSMHWYLQALNYAKDCLRELTFVVLKVVNTEVLRVKDDYTVDLPCGCVDYTKIGVRRGQMIRPLVAYDKFDRLSANEETATFGYGVSWSSVSQDGEHLGRLYGLGAGIEGDIFKVIPERGIIQFSFKLEDEYIVLEYISDGMNITAATQVNPYAQSTIEAGIDKEFKNAGRHYSMQEKQKADFEYDKACRILKARMNPITIEDVKRIFRRNYHGSIK